MNDNETITITTTTTETYEYNDDGTVKTRIVVTEVVERRS
jgi:hypothetical protein